MSTELVLSADQQTVKNTVAAWLDSDQQTLSFGGYAGTGKTTLIKHILEDPEFLIDNPIVCAFTGKAASVLRAKGVADAGTIHSFIYNVYQDDQGNLRSVLKDPASIPGELFIVDEASMVSTPIFRDLLSLERKILWVGDHGQLEPVGDNPNIMADPQIKLEQIHRQAQGNPIIRFAHIARQGIACLQDVSFTDDDDNEHIRLHSAKDISPGEVIEEAATDDARTFPQVIVAFNQFRVEINKAIREELFDTTANAPLVGDRIICLRNNHTLGIYNGEIGYVLNVAEESTSRGFKHYYLSIDFSGRILAITCHKAQGSEFDHVVVLDQPCDLWSPHRWSYTAITRAADQLDYWS